MKDLKWERHRTIFHIKAKGLPEEVNADFETCDEEDRCELFRCLEDLILAGACVEIWESSIQQNPIRQIQDFHKLFQLTYLDQPEEET